MEERITTLRRLAAECAREILGGTRGAAPATLEEWLAISRPLRWQDMLTAWNRQQMGEAVLDDADLLERLEEIEEALPRDRRALAKAFRLYLQRALRFHDERAYHLGGAVERLSAPLDSRPAGDAVSAPSGDLAMPQGVNVLVRGEPNATMAVVLLLLRQASQLPVVICDADTVADLPRLTWGTIVLQNMDRADMATQQTLLAWLDDYVHVQVVTIATADLFARVQAGTFLPALYYRLNTFVIDVDKAVDVGADT